VAHMEYQHCQECSYPTSKRKWLMS